MNTIELKHPQELESAIGAKTVRAAIESTANASVLLQLYTQTVGASPDIHLPAEVDKLTGSTVSTDLIAHQNLAKKNAADFLSQINPMLSSTSAGVIGFGNAWNAEFPDLMACAEKLPDPTARARLATGISLLKGRVSDQIRTIEPLLVRLSDFQKLVIIDHQNLQADSDLVAKAFGGLDGEIARLKAKIDAENTQRGQYIGVIVGGVLGMVGGVIMILVGSLATIATDGLASGLILGGIVLVSGGTGAMITASAELASLDNEITKDSTELAKDQAIFATVEQGRHNAADLAQATAHGVEAISQLRESWQALAGDLEKIEQDLAVANPDASQWVVTALKNANEEWNAALEVAKNLQRFGSLPVSNRKLELVA